MLSNGSLAEDGGFFGPAPLLIETLKREQKGEVGVVSKGGYVCFSPERSKLRYEPVVGLIELLASISDLFLRMTLQLRFQTSANRVADSNKTPDTLRCSRGKFAHEANRISLPDSNFPIYKSKGVWLYKVWSRKSFR